MFLSTTKKVCGLKRKWKHLRDCFSREERCRRGTSSEPRRKPYVYYDMMSFIKNKTFSEQRGIIIKEEMNESSNGSGELRECTTDKQTTATSLVSTQISTTPIISSRSIIEEQTAGTSTESTQSPMSSSMIECTEDETPSAPTQFAENQVPNIINKNSSVLEKEKADTCVGLEFNKFLVALQKLTERKTTTERTNQESNELREFEVEGMEHQEPTTSSGNYTLSFSMELEENQIVKASNDCIRRLTEMETASHENDLDCNIFSPVITEVQTKQIGRTKHRKNNQKDQIFPAINTQTPGIRTNQISTSSKKLQTNQSMRTSIPSEEIQAIDHFSTTEKEILHFSPEYKQKQTPKSTDRTLCEFSGPKTECQKREVAIHGMFECKKLCLALENSSVAKSVEKQEDSDELFFQSLMLEFKLISNEEKAQAKCEMIKMIEAFKIDVSV
ncbi:uncharacterized protein LOC129225859 isoform X2 [Uloborus diversus]|uniref:uncharacterized protein LOC129225859 isoform X2 n=1 Tax=Uloborus diversus TaxID=327109 RepID=UPI00240A5AFB|nr:uncharacterized protein LOC129225859 isoform X2 [Uloborus diversus]